MARGRASSGVSGGAAAGALRASPTRSLRRSGHPVREYILLTCLRWELSSGGERPSATGSTYLGGRSPVCRSSKLHKIKSRKLLAGDRISEIE